MEVVMGWAMFRIYAWIGLRKPKGASMVGKIGIGVCFRSHSIGAVNISFTDVQVRAEESLESNDVGNVL